MKPGAALSYEATPAFSVPLRFFLTAPLFGMLAGLLLMMEPAALASRWTPAALSLTHLITVGFMLMVMTGALFQVLPVVAGAAIPGARYVSAVVHLTLTLGACLLSLGLLLMSPGMLLAAAIVSTLALGIFLIASILGLWATPIGPQATPRDLRLALVGLMVTLALGIALILILSRGQPWPLLELLRLHIGWAWLGGVGLLLAGTSWLVVPMFQITPNYPGILTRVWSPIAFVLLFVWSVCTLMGLSIPATVITALLMLLSALFPVTTLWVQAHSRRAKPDSIFRIIQFSMANILVGLVVVVGIELTLLEGTHWPLVAGILIMHGGFVSFISGMLYKIVPFLAWLNLTQAGVRAPNVKKLLPEIAIKRQLLAHALLSLTLLVAAISGDPLLIRLSGMGLVVAFALLLSNLFKVFQQYGVQQKMHSSYKGIAE